MEYLSDIDDLNEESISKQSIPDYVVDFFSCSENKDDRELGLVYITPYQVMQSFFDQNGSHDEIGNFIESNILNKVVQTRLILRCYRRYMKDCPPIDTFAWDVCLQNSKVKVREITREMYSVALAIQKYIITMIKAQGIEIDKDFCVLLDDLIEDRDIEILDDSKKFLEETIYGLTLKDYLQKFNSKIQPYVPTRNSYDKDKTRNLYDEDAR